LASPALTGAPTINGSDALSQAVGNATYVATCGLSGGLDDAAFIQSLLTASRLAGGGLVKGLPGQSYVLGATLIVGSNTTLDFSGCTLTLKAGNAVNHLNNYSFANAQTVMGDGAITAGSAALVCATTLPFGASVAGTPVTVWGAGLQGSPLRTTVATKTDSGHVTLADPALTTTAAATVSVGVRDRNVRVIGGTWLRGGNAGGSPGTADVLRFRRVDGLSIANAYFPDGSGFHNVCVGDCTNFEILSPRIATTTGQTDLVHLHGPLDGGRLQNVQGFGTSALVSITPNDYVGSNDVYGPVSNLSIDFIHADAGNAAVLLAIVAGTPGANGVYARGITGPTISPQGAIFIGDDVASANTQGGRLDDIQIDGIRAQASAASSSLIQVGGTNIGRLRVGGIYEDHALINYSRFINVGSGTVESLTVHDFTLGTFTAFPNLVQVVAGATINNLIISRGRGANIGYMLATNGAATVNRIVINDLAFTGHLSFFQIDSATAVCPNAEISNTNSNGTGWAIGDIGCSMEIHMVNVTSSPTANALINLNAASAVVTLHASNCNFQGLQPQGTAGAKLRARTLGVQVDLSNTSLAKTTNDMAYNTNAALACGAGPVGYTGAAWKHLISGLTY
jgi:hypothetical protein